MPQRFSCESCAGVALCAGSETSSAACWLRTLISHTQALDPPTSYSHADPFSSIGRPSFPTRSPSMRFLSARAAVLLLLGALARPMAVAGQKPESTISRFPHLPSKSASLSADCSSELKTRLTVLCLLSLRPVFYFDDTEVRYLAVGRPRHTRRVRGAARKRDGLTRPPLIPIAHAARPSRPCIVLSRSFTTIRSSRMSTDPITKAKVGS